MEAQTIVNCAKYLEIAFQGLDRDLVHYLHREGFISQEVYDEVLYPRSMLSQAQKAGQLVTGIRTKVSLSPQHYLKFVDRLRSRRQRFGGIVDILEREYEKLQRKGMSCSFASHAYFFWESNCYTLLVTYPRKS